MSYKGIIVLVRMRYGMRFGQSFISNCRPTIYCRKITSSSYYPSDTPYQGKTKDHHQEELAKDADLLKIMIPIFPTPKNTLDNYLRLPRHAKDFKCSTTFVSRGPKHNHTFICQLKIEGLLNEEFVGHAKQKKTAEAIATLKAISVLCEENLMTSEGKLPVEDRKTSKKVSRRQLKEGLRAPIPLSVSSDCLEEAFALINRYKQNFQPFITSTISEVEKTAQDDQTSANFYDFITGRWDGLQEPYENYHQEPDRNSSFEISQRHYANTYKIYPHKDEILEKIAENQIILIEGGTGCGKSTQVPQYIFEESLSKNQDCNIVVTQPRRVATRALASFIAKERNEMLGWRVGFKMRLHEWLPSRRNGIVFYTLGSLQRSMSKNKTLEGVTHIIVDEIHERNSEVDVLLCLLKDVMIIRPDLKIILMSATMDVSIFLNYFGVNESSLIKIRGENYPIKKFTSSDLGQELGLRIGKNLERKLLDSPFKRVDYKAVVDVVTAIHQNKCPGAVLVFLPKYFDINTICRTLSTNLELHVLPLHGGLSNVKQQLVFDRPPSGKRKVILATNIAETSITIDDVVYVVDSGLQNFSTYNSRLGMKTFGLSFISKANAIQRAGRAGRTQPGEVYRLYSQQIYDSFQDQPLPEVLTTDLEPLIVRIRCLLPEDRSIGEFFDSLLDAPEPLNVQQAVKNLVFIGVLSFCKDSERLTTLGRIVSQIPTSPYLAKSLVYSYLLRCYKQVLTLCSLESKMTSMLGDVSNSSFAELKSRYDSNSDIIAIEKLVTDMGLLDEPDTEQEDGTNIDVNKFKTTRKIKKMLDGCVIRNLELYDPSKIDFQTLGQNKNQLILGSFVASALSLFRRIRDSNSKFLFTDNGMPILINKDSVLNGQPPPCVEESSVLLCSDVFYSEMTCNEPNCQEVLWTEDPHPLCLLHRRCITIPSLQLLRMSCRFCLEIIEAGQAKQDVGDFISSVILAWRQQNGEKSKDVLTPGISLEGKTLKDRLVPSFPNIQERFIMMTRDASIVNPLTAVLFYGQSLEISKEAEEGGECLLSIPDSKLSFQSDYLTALCLQELKRIMLELLDFIIIYPNCLKEKTSFTDNYLEELEAIEEKSKQRIDERQLVKFIKDYSSNVNKLISINDDSMNDDSI